MSAQEQQETKSPRHMVEIITSGELIHSPLPERRKFNVKMSSKVKHPLKLLEEIAEVLSSVLNYAVSPLPPFKEYAFSFCKYCNRERGELCLRHRTVIEAPIGNESNWEYKYAFDMYSIPHADIVKFHFELGSGWVIDGAVVYHYNERPANGAIRVIRPNGKAFTYRLKPGKPSSAAYIIRKIMNFLWGVVRASYTNVEVNVP